MLDITEPVYDLADIFVSRNLLPAKVLIDALHVAIATIHGVDFVIAWNCKFIANGEISRRLDVVCQERGYRLPNLCTPKELMGTAPV